MIALPETECVGCASCANICPAKAISMKPDEEGFLHPVLNQELCVDCGKCVNHCPVLTDIYKDFNNDEEPLAVYSGWSLDEETRLTSSSGGLFAEIAKTILEQNGYVAAVTYTEEHTAKHIIINSLAELENLKRSKYLQSDTGDSYLKIKDLLKQKKKVLFVGTPCQCAGLITFLGNKPENLVLVDFICHGVNSPMVHQKYIQEVERELGVKVKEINHRDKHLGWENFQFSIADNKRKYLLGAQRQNPFLRGFLTNAYLRQTCFNCKFKGQKRPIDLTLGDCWGYEENAGREKGVSVLIIHSNIGIRIILGLDESVYLKKCSIEDVVRKNSMLTSSVVDKYDLRNNFFPRLNDGIELHELIVDLLGE